MLRNVAVLPLAAVGYVITAVPSGESCTRGHERLWYGTGIGWKEFCVGNFHAMLELLSLLATIPYFSAWFALLSLF